MLLERLFALLLNERVVAVALCVLLMTLGFLALLEMFINYFPEFAPTKAGTIPAPKGRG